MARVIQRLRILVQHRPWLALVGGLVLLLIIGPLLLRLLLLLALLLIPMGIGVLIGWQLRSDPSSMGFIVGWREQFLDGLAVILEGISRWLMYCLAVLQNRKAAYAPPQQDHRRD